MTTADRGALVLVRIPEQVMTVAEACVVEASPNELGGILVGWWEGNSVAVVEAMLAVPDWGAGRTHYERKHSPAQEVLDAYRLGRGGPRAGYIGEWHSHPAPQPPSSTDRSALSALVRQERRPVALVVLSLRPEGRMTLHALIGRPRWPRRAAIDTASVERMP